MARCGARHRGRATRHRHLTRCGVINDRNHFARQIDAGTGRICASFAAESAAWLAVGTCHSAYGFIEFSALPPFDAAERGIPAAARRYREMMLDPRYGCVRVELDGSEPKLRGGTGNDPLRPRWTDDGITVEVDGDLNGDTLRQSWSIRAARHGRPRVVLSVGGRIDRPALAEITEVDPPRPTGAATTVTITDDGLVLAAPRLPAVARIAIAGCAVAWHATPDHHVAGLAERRRRAHVRDRDHVRGVAGESPGPIRHGGAGTSGRAPAVERCRPAHRPRHRLRAGLHRAERGA